MTAVNMAILVSAVLVVVGLVLLGVGRTASRSTGGVPEGKKTRVVQVGWRMIGTGVLFGLLCYLFAIRYPATGIRAAISIVLLVGGLALTRLGRRAKEVSAAGAKPHASLVSQVGFSIAAAGAALVVLNSVLALAL